MKERGSKSRNLGSGILFFILLLACAGTTTTTQKGCTRPKINPCDQDMDGFKAIGWVSYINAKGKTAKMPTATVISRAVTLM